VHERRGRDAAGGGTALSESTDFRPCAVVPTYQNPLTVRAVVEGILVHGLPVVVVDDGSDEPGRAACAALAADGLADVLHRPRNGGKGLAVKEGFARAVALGYTHAFQIDGDGQHDLAQIPEFLAAGARNPEALVIGVPVYDETAPRARRIARHFTTFWVRLEVGGKGIVEDAMIGFRIYPLEAALAVPSRARRMDFDIEILVLMVRAGVPVLNLPVRVRYPTAEEGGVSHFKMVRDNARFSMLHARLCTGGALGWLKRKVLRAGARG